MPDSCIFAVDVFHIVCERLRSKAADLQLLAATDESFEEWLACEAYLACKLRQEDYPFCEVTVRPTYASEGVSINVGDLDRTIGDLRVGGPNDGADHCWLFAEVVLAGDGAPTDRQWLDRAEAATGRLMRLGWKKSTALLIVISVRSGSGPLNLAEYWTNYAVWNRLALTDPYIVPLPGGGSIVVKAFDTKQNPSDLLSVIAQ